MESFLTIWLPISVALVGICILYTGWRGRRVDQHPLCPRCGFDLFGKPELTNIVCPECGHRVRSRREVRIGHRKARRGLIYLSLALLLPSLLTLSIAGTLAARGMKWIQLEPVSWLIRIGDARDATGAAAAAFEELDRRLTKRELSTQQLNDVLDHALAVQGDMSGLQDPKQLRFQPNEGLWCAFVEHARKLGQVSDDRWQRYAEQSVVFLLMARPHVRRGDAIPFTLVQLQRHRESWFKPTYTLALEIDGQPVQVLPPNYERPAALYEDTQLTWFVPPTDPVYQKLTDGEHNAEVTIDASMPGRSPRNLFPPLRAAKRQTSIARFALQPAEKPSVETDSDPKLKPQIEQWLRGRSLELASLGQGNGELHVRLAADWPKELPIDLAFRVTVRADGKDWPCTFPICLQGRNGSTTGMSFAKVKNFQAKTADIILRSDPAAAARTLNIERIWDGEIVLKDVPIEPW